METDCPPIRTRSQVIKVVRFSLFPDSCVINMTHVPVFSGFSASSQNENPVGIHLELFGPFRIRLDAFGSLRKRLDRSKFRKKFEIRFGNLIQSQLKFKKQS